MSAINQRISIVIPVYNEAAALGACLRSIAAQIQPACEVIVINNNSTDATAAIASSFSFVTLINQPLQGVVHARNLGFNAATGNIIGRVDADSILAADWTIQLCAIFAQKSPSRVDAVSGSVSYHDMPYKRLVTALDLGFRSWIACGMGSEVFLYGANMALRRSAWHKVRSQVCNNKGLHEDFDLAIHLHDMGARVEFCPELHASVSLRRIQSSPSSFIEYARLNPYTYSSHGRTSHIRMYPVIALVLVGYGAIRAAHKSYDSATNTMSLVKLFAAPQTGRVNPATFVD